MGNINVSKKSYDRQLAAGYIAYMMGASCFHSSVCKSPALERTLLLHYREMPDPKALRAEDQVLRDLDRLGTGFLRKLSDLNCEVRFTVKDGTLSIRFDTGGFETLSAQADAAGHVWLYACN